MAFFAGIFVGLVIGGGIALVVICLCIVAARADAHMEEPYPW